VDFSLTVLNFYRFPCPMHNIRKFSIVNIVVALSGHIKLSIGLCERFVAIPKGRHRRRLRWKSFAQTHTHPPEWCSHASFVWSSVFCEKLILRSPPDIQTTIASCGLTGARTLHCTYLTRPSSFIPTCVCTRLMSWQVRRCRRNGWAFVGH